MTGKGTMKLLTALMSAFLAAGVFGGVQLDAAAASDEVQEAAFSEPEEPVQVNVTPAITTDGKAFTWTSLENADYSGNDRYDMDGTRYIAGTWHGFAVSKVNDANMDGLIFLDDGTNLTDDDGTIRGYVTIDRIITDMMVKDLNDNNNVIFSSGAYYLYICQDNKFSKASDRTFSYTEVSAGGAAPAAEWYCYERNYVKKVIDEGTVDSPTAWHYEFYETAEGEEWPETCPEGYEVKKNYKVVIKDSAVNDDTVTGFIVEPVDTGGSFLDRNGSQQAVLYRGEGDVPGATSTHILIDSFEGLTVKAIRRNGTISPAAPVTKMAPWKAWDAQNTVALNNAVTVNAAGRASFIAPEFTKDFDTWHDDMGTDDPDDDRDYVNGFGYRVYVNKQDAASDVSRYAELFIENETVREREGNTAVDTSYIWRNSVLIAMNELYINKGVLFESGTYDVYAVAGYNRKDYYYSNPFQVVFTPPTGEAGDHEIFYNSYPVWIRDTEHGIEEYERQENEDDDAVRAKMQTQGYEDYYEMKRADLFIDDADATGYIVNTG
ncbi:MAG: hypothetical protein K6C95_10890, partial [Lachnospiraceae bacterium]|nr:hypothetical protein [Lachnospiraceae bacterium]